MCAGPIAAWEASAPAASPGGRGSARRDRPRGPGRCRSGPRSRSCTLPRRSYWGSSATRMLAADLEGFIDARAQLLIPRPSSPRRSPIGVGRPSRPSFSISSSVSRCRARSRSSSVKTPRAMKAVHLVERGFVLGRSFARRGGQPGRGCDDDEAGRSHGGSSRWRFAHGQNHAMIVILDGYRLPTRLRRRARSPSIARRPRGAGSGSFGGSCSVIHASARPRRRPRQLGLQDAADGAAQHDRAAAREVRRVDVQGRLGGDAAGVEDGHDPRISVLEGTDELLELRLGAAALAPLLEPPARWAATARRRGSFARRRAGAAARCPRR